MLDLRESLKNSFYCFILRLTSKVGQHCVPHCLSRSGRSENASSLHFIIPMTWQEESKALRKVQSTKEGPRKDQDDNAEECCRNMCRSPRVFRVTLLLACYIVDPYVGSSSFRVDGERKGNFFLMSHKNKIYLLPKYLFWNQLR